MVSFVLGCLKQLVYRVEVLLIELVTFGISYELGMVTLGRGLYTCTRRAYHIGLKIYFKWLHILVNIFVWTVFACEYSFYIVLLHSLSVLKR